MSNIVKLPNGKETVAFTSSFDYTVANQKDFNDNSGSITIIDHGVWKPYDLLAELKEADLPPLNVPTGALFAKRVSDSEDWYAYSRPGDKFDKTGILATAIDTDKGWRILGVFLDRTFILPLDMRVIEIRNFNGSIDAVHKNWEGKYFDPDKLTILDYVNNIDDLINYAQVKKKEIEEGGIVVNGYPVATDRASQAMITQTIVSFTLNPDLKLNWKGSDGSFTLLDSATLRAIALCVINHVATTFDVLANCVGEVRSGKLKTNASIDEYLKTRIPTTFPASA